MNTPTSESSRRTLRIIPFVCALFCFALPFVQVSCSGRVESVTGLKCISGIKELHDRQTPQNVQFYAAVSQIFFATAAAFTVLAGLASITRGIGGSIIATIFGAAAILVLIIARNAFDRLMMELAGGLIITQWQLGYFASCVLNLVGALATLVTALQRQHRLPLAT